MVDPADVRGNREREGRSDDVRIDLGWDDIQPHLAARWPKLNERDLQALASEIDDLVTGNSQLLVGRLREHYGLSQSDAEGEVRVFVRAVAGGAIGAEHSSPKVGYGKSRG